VGHTSRSSGLLHLGASQARVSQSGLKAGGGTVRMGHVALSCGVEAKDDGSMRRAAWDSSTPTLSFSFYFTIRAF
jgi:hypothetical protein